MDWQNSAVAKAAGRGLAAIVALGSVVFLLDAGAKYPGLAWGATNLTREPSPLEQDVTAPGFTPREFRLSANLPLQQDPTPCAAPKANPESPTGDERFDNSCTVPGSTVKGVGELARSELLSWRGDWLYHRAVRF
jgi:hypothetical protein